VSIPVLFPFRSVDTATVRFTAAPHHRRRVTIDHRPLAGATPPMLLDCAARRAGGELTHTPPGAPEARRGTRLSRRCCGAVGLTRGTAPPMWLRPNRVALRRTVGAGQGDGSASRIQPRHRHGRLPLRSAQPLAAPHRREHQRLAKAVLSERHRLSACSPEDLAAVAAGLNSRPRKTLDCQTPAERLNWHAAAAGAGMCATDHCRWLHPVNSSSRTLQKAHGRRHDF
jgi:hypothetical protein